MSSGSPGQPWRVDYIRRDELFARLTRLRELAGQRGIAGVFNDTLERIQERLREDPLGWGDPLYEAKHAKFVYCHGTLAPPHAFFAVHEASRNVWVQDILPVPGWGLDED